MCDTDDSLTSIQAQSNGLWFLSLDKKGNTNKKKIFFFFNAHFGETRTFIDKDKVTRARRYVSNFWWAAFIRATRRTMRARWMLMNSGSKSSSSSTIGEWSRSCPLGSPRFVFNFSRESKHFQFLPSFYLQKIKRARERWPGDNSAGT